MQAAQIARCGKSGIEAEGSDTGEGCDPTTSECILYTFGLCCKQDDCERYQSPPAGTRTPCALPQANSDTLVSLGLSQNTVVCRKGPKCVFEHSGWTPATYNKTTVELKKKHMAKSQKTNTRQKKKRKTKHTMDKHMKKEKNRKKTREKIRKASTAQWDSREKVPRDSEWRPST